MHLLSWRGRALARKQGIARIKENCAEMLGPRWPRTSKRVESRFAALPSCQVTTPYSRMDAFFEFVSRLLLIEMGNLSCLLWRGMENQSLVCHNVPYPVIDQPLIQPLARECSLGKPMAGLHFNYIRWGFFVRACHESTNRCKT